MQDRSSIPVGKTAEDADDTLGQRDANNDPGLFTRDGKNAAAVMLGRRGGLKGGVVRAERLTSDQKREIALKGAAARWGKKIDVDGN